VCLNKTGYVVYGVEDGVAVGFGLATGEFPLMFRNQVPRHLVLGGREGVMEAHLGCGRLMIYRQYMCCSRVLGEPVVFPNKGI
jgi:hypothetical protein